MKKALSYILLCIPLFAVAQKEDSIPRYTTVSPDRQLLLEKFRAARLDSVALLVDSIDRHHVTPLLWSAERLLLYYWIERYHAIDSLALHFDKVAAEAASNPPAEQVVWNVLSFYSLENIDMLVSWIDQSECDDKEFGFRVRLLETVLFGDWDEQESINREIVSFVNRYLHEVDGTQQELKQPESEQSADPWGLKFGLGLGPTSVSGKIADYLSTNAAISFNFNVYYNRWNFSLLLQPIFAKLKRDIPVGEGDDVWETGKSAIIGNYGFALGYSMINGKFLKVNPFIGFSISDCTPTEQQMLDNNVLRNAGIYGGLTTIYGIETLFRLHKIDFLKLNDFPLSLAVRLNYIPSMFNNVNPRYSGNMFFYTFGINMELATW